MNTLVLKHFQKVDPVLYNAALQAGQVVIGKSTDYFADLCEDIISQQLSEKAGSTIFGRFVKLFPKGRVTSEAVMKLSEAQIREVGTSNSKARFIKRLATSVMQKEIDLQALDTLPDEQVIAELVKLHGIGPWTAEMFLMFSLGREDLFSYGDLGLRRAIQKLYKIKKEPTIGQMEKITKKWSPYRTWACRVLWKSLEF